MSQGPTILRHRLIVLAFVFVAFSIRMVSAEEARTWNSASGKFSVEAELLQVRGDVLKLKRSDGKTFDVKLSSLSQADRD